LNTRLHLLIIAIPFFIPAIWRLYDHTLTEPAGLLSDLCLGLLLSVTVMYSPHWLRIILLNSWAFFQIVAQELFSAIQRLPTWQDVHYMLDPTFVENSTAGFHMAVPVLTIALMLTALAACFIPIRRPGRGYLLKGLGVALLLFAAHNSVGRSHDYQSIAARYNPLHWFIVDALAQPLSQDTKKLTIADLPPSLRELDLNGKPLLPKKGTAKNVLIVTLEGIPGMYIPEIREAMHVPGDFDIMQGLVDNTRDAMLVPDFVDHSHQTIRGLYALHCGDFSKFSYDMPKAFELLTNPERAAECLPAQMAAHGWETHYLQGAGLQFMNKDRAMPAMGFQEVHGLEWFTERTNTDFEWGTTDEDFFIGARKYIHTLQAKNKPWLLSLLTVATHQPFAASDELTKKYGSRKAAAIALLDDAVSQFIKGLRQDGIMKDTLVIITSDESHGSEKADWYSSWGLAAVIAPDQEKLPRLQKGSFGMVDFEASILDYLGLPMPPSIIGRSIFREYSTPRDMLSFTSNKLRWHSAAGLRYECSVEGNCRAGKSPSLLGLHPEVFEQDTENTAARLFAITATLDHKLSSNKQKQVLQFASGERRQLPEKIKNEWADNLAGAQYLDFPANSKVHVDIRLKAVKAPESGVQMKLTMRVFEQLVTHIPYPPFPILHEGEEAHVEFDFYNPTILQSFSFHLVGEGKNAEIQLDKFEVTIDRGKS
jgi:hypothetical protein